MKANVLFFDRKPASATTWTKQLWIYDLRTNKHFTLKTNPLKREDLDEFVRLYHPGNRHDRKPTWSAAADAKAGTGPEGRWRVYGYEELIAREIIEDLEAALEQFRLIEADLNGSGGGTLG